MKRFLLYRITTCFVMLMCVSYAKSQHFSFDSYHVYMTNEDKFSTTNVQNDSAKVCIDEVNQEIELCLYRKEFGKWMPISLHIDYSVDISGPKSKIGNLYVCENAAKQRCTVLVDDTSDGVFIDFHDFMPMNCWLKKE